MSLLPAIVLLPVVTFAQEPKGSSAAIAAQEQCKISGMVVKLAGSEPLRKARIELLGQDEGAHSVSVMTDAGGRFALKNIDSGRYKLFVSRAGYVTQEYGQRKPDDPGAILTLRPGQEMKDLVFRLIPSAVIAGKILDDDGEPLAQVLVRALRETYVEGKRSLAVSDSVSTDDLGEYRLFGLAPGKYLVSAVYRPRSRFGGKAHDSENSDQPAEGYAKMYYPGTPDRAKATPITVKSGEEVPSIGILMRQVAVYHVRGHVYNQMANKPGMEANIALVPKRTGGDWEFSDKGTNVQKKDGSFDIQEVLPGSYILAAFWSDGEKTYSGRLPVEVGSSNVEGLSVTLGPGVNINGEVVWDGRPSLERDELDVGLEPVEGAWYFSSSARVTPKNSFTLKNVTEGPYRAYVYGQSKDCYIKDMKYGESSALEDGFTVAPGAPASLEISISSRGARLQGGVADADGLPAAGVWVVLVPEPPRRGVARFYETQNTDQYGHFDLRGIAPGDYKLFSWEEAENGSWEDPDFLKPFEDKGEKTSLQEGEQKSLNLTVIRTKSSEPVTP